MNSTAPTTLHCILSGTAILGIISLAVPATVPCGVVAQEHDDLPSPVGSVDDYMREQHSEIVQEVPELGVEVTEGGGRLAEGTSLRGIRVIRVIPDGPGARAGLRDERIVGKSVLAGALFAGGLFFPPAFFVAIAVAGSDVGDSHDTIIAVDSERTRDVQELEDAIGKSREGPVIYLSVVREGHRSQVQVFLQRRRRSDGIANLVSHLCSRKPGARYRARTLPDPNQKFAGIISNRATYPKPVAQVAMAALIERAGQLNSWLH